LLMEVTFGQQKWFSSVKELFTQFWRPDFPAMEPSFYEWQFRANPFLPDDIEEGCLLAIEDKRVIGYLGFIFAPFRVHGRVVSGGYPVHLLVHPQYRGKGLATSLYRKLMERVEIAAGTAINPLTRGLYLRLGCRYFGELPRWIGILDPEACMALLPDPTQSRAIVARRQIPAPPFPEQAYLLTGRFNRAMDDLWTRLATDLPVASMRNAAYLNWRYMAHPVFRYETVVLEDSGRWSAVGIFRVENVRDRQEQVMRVMEFLAQAESQQALARALVAEAHRRRCAIADFFGLSERPIRGLVSSGFFHEHEEPELNLPFLFQPLDHKRLKQTFVCWSRVCLSDGVPAHADLSSWYISKGDGDQDRPN
jgi:GNAT superfamily N-acetyltransferase